MLNALNVFVRTTIAQTHERLIPRSVATIMLAFHTAMTAAAA